MSLCRIWLSDSMNIQIYLSTLSPLPACLFSIYTVMTTVAVILLFPLCILCSNHKPFSHQLHFFLSPPIGFQLGLIYSEHNVSSSPGEHPAMLIVINLCSPFYAVWISVSAWVAAAFWAFTTIMGNPDGKDRKDDGREAVMGVRRWWERWLGRALR